MADPSTDHPIIQIPPWLWLALSALISFLITAGTSLMAAASSLTPGTTLTTLSLVVIIAGGVIQAAKDVRTSIAPSVTGRLASLALLALTTVGAVGCASQPVTLHQQPVTDPTIQRLAQVVHGADVTTSSIVRFLIAGHRAGSLPTAVLQGYLDDIAPAVQTALDGARETLVTYAQTPALLPQERVEQHLVALTQALQRATLFAQHHGWQAPGGAAS